MSEQQTKNKYAGYAFGAWAAALAVFVGVLVVVSLRMPALHENMTAEEAAQVKKLVIRAKSGVYDPGYVLHSLPKPDGIKVPAPDFSNENKYVLVGYGLQGLYQSSPEGLPWQIDEQEKVVEAQLIQRGAMPKVVSVDIKMSWALDSAAYLDNGTVVFASKSGEMEAVDKNRSFSAAIDASVQMKDGAAFNPYQVLTLKAEDASSGETLAQSAAVLAVSPGYGCVHCHADPGYGILTLHDKSNNTTLADDARSGSTVFCSSCHNGATFEDGEYQAGMEIGFSSAVHGWHAQYLENCGGEACMTCHINLGAHKGAEDEAPQALFMRDVHHMRGLSCVTCHGYMEDHAIALLRAEQKAGQELAARNLERLKPRAVEKTAEINPRLPWLQEPDCTSCHDFDSKPVATEVSAFNTWTDLPEKDEGLELFSMRMDYSGIMRCTSCHGAPHATYPAENPVAEGLDNIVPMQYQQQALVLGDNGNCALCHMQSMPMPIHHPIVERSSVEVDVPQKAELMMPKVLFSHEAHTPQVECGTCHHMGYKDGGPIRCTSAGCHNLAETDDAEKDEEFRYFREAFHSDKLPSCLACHEGRRKKWLPAGPTDCDACHLAPPSMWKEE